MASAVSTPLSGAASVAAQSSSIPASRGAAVLVLAVLAVAPWLAVLAGQEYHLTLVSRVMIYALAAVGLNLVLGYGSMVSFGHALYFGLGAYAVGILAHHGITGGFTQLAVALIVGAIVAVLVGLVCLRASGMAFIMITLAFAQMFYYVVLSIKAYGGDDGLPIATRSRFPGLDLDRPIVLYYLVFALLVATLFFFHRLVAARFGVVLRGTRSNLRRLRALGVPTTRYRLAAYVVSALVCVVAGMLFANLTRFASPSYAHWIVSGELITMIVLGGVGTLFGPIVGAAIWIVLEEVLTSFPVPLPYGTDGFLRDHWQLVFGVFVVVVTLTLQHGLYGSFVRRGTARATSAHDR